MSGTCIVIPHLLERSMLQTLAATAVVRSLTPCCTYFILALLVLHPLFAPADYYCARCNTNVLLQISPSCWPSESRLWSIEEGFCFRAAWWLRERVIFSKKKKQEMTVPCDPQIRREFYFVLKNNKHGKVSQRSFNVGVMVSACCWWHASTTFLGCLEKELKLQSRTSVWNLV